MLTISNAANVYANACVGMDHQKTPEYKACSNAAADRLMESARASSIEASLEREYPSFPMIYVGAPTVYKEKGELEIRLHSKVSNWDVAQVFHGWNGFVPEAINQLLTLEQQEILNHKSEIESLIKEGL